MWSHLESSGIICSHLESSGAIWSHLESSGVIWNHLESSGVIWSHLESSGVTKETPRRHPGGTQETPRRHPEAPRAPEAILSKNVPKALRFTAKTGASTYFVREWRRRHAPLPQPAHRNESTQPRAERKRKQGPFDTTP